jgi:hypothetical protein
MGLGVHSGWTKPVAVVVIGVCLGGSGGANAQGTGDFNGDGCGDLAIGKSGQDVDGF